MFHVSKKYVIMIMAITILGVIAILMKTGWMDKCIKERYADEWAIYNYGQRIDKKNGIRGYDINILPAWDITKGCSDVLVAVIDTGVDESCDIFQTTELLSGWDYYNNDSTTYDQYIHDYHGTYICSTIAKVAPEISILPVKFMESTSGCVEDAVKCIKYAIEQGADIINCSWNFYDYNQELYDVIKENPDVLFVCATGNYNANIDYVDIYPCSYNLDNIISVLAIDNTGEIYSTSGYGKNTVHVAAPGVSIKVTLPEDDETYVDGTSVATAFVSATAGLILSTDSSLNAVEIKEIILKSVQSIEGIEDLCISGGMIDIYNSIN